MDLGKFLHALNFSANHALILLFGQMNNLKDFKSMLQNPRRYCFCDINPNKFQIDDRIS